MGKKGKRKKKKTKNTPAADAANLQAAASFGSSGPIDYGEKEDREFVEYVQRLKERHRILRGGSQENMYFIQACDLTSQALKLATQGLLDQAANLLSNSWLTDYRATKAASMHYIFIAKIELLDFVNLLQSLILTDNNMTATKCNLTYMLMGFAPGFNPEENINYLDQSIAFLTSPSNPNVKTDTASLLIQKSTQYMKLGREKYALKCLNKAAKIAKGEVEGNSALYMSLCLRRVGLVPSDNISNLSKDIRDLRFLMTNVHVECRVYYDICIRLSNLLMFCGEGSARKEGVALQKQHDVSLLALQKLHNPFNNLRVTQAREFSTAIMAGCAEHVRAGLPFKPCKFHIPPAVAQGNADITDAKPGKLNEIFTSTEICMGCGASGIKLLKCSRCKTTQYCKAECQRNHWSVHKKQCKSLKAARERGVATIPKMGKQMPSEKTPEQLHHEKLGLPGQATQFNDKAGTASGIMTQRKWISKTVQDKQFVQWWVQLDFAKRKEYVTYFLPDMSLKWKDEEDGLFPALAVDYLCGNQCQCSDHDAITNHGVASGLLCQMWRLTRHSLEDNMDNDLIKCGKMSCAGKFHFGPKRETIVVQRERGKEDKFLILTNPGNLSDEKNPATGRSMNDLINDPQELSIVWRLVRQAASTKRLIWHSVVLGCVDMYHEHHIKEATPNLILRSGGCGHCGKELPLYYIGGQNINCPFSDVGEQVRCFVCKGEAWCSTDCRKKQTPQHSLKCYGQEMLSRAIRATLPDKSDTGGTM